MKLSSICSQYITSHMKKPLSRSHSQYFLGMLDGYDENLSSMLYYGAISYNNVSLMAGTEYEYDNIIDPEGFAPKTFFDRLTCPKGERYAELIDLFRLSNRDKYDYIFIPVLVRNNMLCYVCSPRKSELLSYLGLKDGKDIYDKYSLLISLLNWGITYIIPDSEEERRNDLYITDVKRGEDYVRVKASIVDKVLKEKWLPYASTIHVISSWNYEQQANYGYINFREPLGNRESELKVKFANPLMMSAHNVRTIRKYVELSNESLRLVAESSKGYIYGDFMPEDLYWSFIGLGDNDDDNILATVRFEGKASWRMLFEKESIYYNGSTYIFRRECIEEPKYVLETMGFFQNIALVTHEDADEKAKIINEIIRLACAQKHGTMIIVSPKASEETERLCKCGRGIKIAPINFDEIIRNHENEAQEILLNLTKIDGAIFFDDKGICYSIGTIVDGYACMNSNPGRGARYNSAYTYVNYCNERDIQCFCAVISEDETIDVFGRYGKKMEEEIQRAYKQRTIE